MTTNLQPQDPTPNRQPKPHAPPFRNVAPRVDVYENGQEFLIVAEVPGASKESVNVSLDGGELTLSAKREGRALENKEPELGVQYYRAFSMPDTIDDDKVDAELTNGLLRVKLPKRAEVKARKIAIRAS